MALKCIGMPSRPTDEVRHVHIFDLDRTLLKSNSGLRLCVFLRKKGYISYSSWLSCSFRYLLYKCRLVSMVGQMKVVFDHLFKGRERGPLCAHLEDFWQHDLSLDLRGSLLFHLQEAKNQGHVVALFSAGPDFLVDFVASKLGMHFVLATEYRLDQLGLSFLSLGAIATGPLKAQSVLRLKNRFKKATFHGYSDSWDDVEFLQAVEKPWVVAGDPMLSRWARENPNVQVWPV